MFALDPARANLVARIKGNGSKRPLLILAHTDVVGIQPEKWPVDPFGAVIKDGYVWGRGSVDDKPVLAANLMVMLLLKRNRVALDRDVIFLAESGEEADTTGVGINFMVKDHYDEIDAEYSLTEGGDANLEGGKVVTVSIGTAEKLPARVRLVATGTSGHGSVPRMDNALVHLGAAIEKVGRWQTPMRLNDTTRTYFEKMANISPPAKAAHYKGLLNPQTSEAAQRYLLENEPQSYSMLRTSVVPTMFKAGVGANVIPSEAEATLDIRALPDENITGFYAEMGRIINDPAVKIVPLPRRGRRRPYRAWIPRCTRYSSVSARKCIRTSRSYRRCRRARVTRPSFAPRGSSPTESARPGPSWTGRTTERTAMSSGWRRRPSTRSSSSSGMP